MCMCVTFSSYVTSCSLYLCLPPCIVLISTAEVDIDTLLCSFGSTVDRLTCP